MTQAKDAGMNAATPGRQPALHWRFEFSSYGETRHFLDLLADLSKRENFYPSINFGKTYVNVSIDAEDQTQLGIRAAVFVEEMKAHAAQEQT